MYHPQNIAPKTTFNVTDLSSKTQTEKFLLNQTQLICMRIPNPTKQLPHMAPPRRLCYGP